MRQMIFFLLITLISAACTSQDSKKINKLIGGPCEGCEAIHEFGDKKLINEVTLPIFMNSEPKLKITGTVFKKDGKTPAKDIILYFYHTNREGIYKNTTNDTGWGKRHGSLRGWLKTNSDGHYTIHTIRPASYPNRQEPEHIHLTVKEPNKNEYYIDDILFSDDPKLTNTIKSNLNNRCGSGIVTLSLENDIYVANRNIILGLNIPDYY